MPDTNDFRCRHMVYLSHFAFPDIEKEYDFSMAQKRTCYDTFYPFFVLSKHGLHMLDFEPVTILYGGNGSGKTTALNVIGERLKLCRDTLYNRTNFFEDYLDLCSFETEEPIPKDSRIITSDDVFDFMLNLRSLNAGIDQKREDLFQEYLEDKYSHFQMKSLDDYERLKKVNMAKSRTCFSLLHGKNKGKRIVSSGRAGKQSFSGQTAGTFKVS